MTTDPRVSVVVTCYNLGRYLEEAVASVLEQTLDEVEILVVDDGSTDPATVALLADYRRPRTQVLHTPNRGLPAARNHGIARARAPYVCALDADDRLERTWLEKGARALDSDPSLAFVSHWLRTFGDEEGEWTPTECDLVALLDSNTVNGAALVRREALQAVGGFEESLRDGAEDWDLWLRMAERGLRGTILPEVLFFYRRRADSMSRAMLREPTYSTLLRRLVQRHETSYRAHFPELLVRRERRMWAMRVGIHDLRLEHEVWLRPELARQRQETAALREKVERARRQAAQARAAAQAGELHDAWRGAEERAAQLDTRLHEAEASLQAAQASLQAAQEGLAEARRGEAARSQELENCAMERDRRGGELLALRRSSSWRLTAPLRALHRWLAPRGRG
jgi:glycosyltransferase involved in cell wall biosynthesis